MPDFRLPPLNIGERFYRACLWAYPGSFRRAFGLDLVETFRDERRAAGQRSGGTALAFWMETLRDVVTQGIAERCAAMARVFVDRETDRDTDRDTVREGPMTARRNAFVILLQDALQDLRIGARALRRTPAFTAVAVLTLSLCIGATTAVFTVVHGVLIKPLPFEDPGALVSIRHTANDARGNAAFGLSGALVTTYARESRALLQVGLWSRSTENVTEDVMPEEVTSLNVSLGTLPALGVRPVRGRAFSEADHTPGSPETVILTDGYWRRRFGGDASIIGRQVTINARPRAVVGVMPPTFHFLSEAPDVILPLRFTPDSLTLGGFSYEGLARLAPGVTVEQASADLRRVIPIWLDAWPSFPGADRSAFVKAEVTPVVRPLKEELVGNVDTTLWVLMGTVGIVWLIACANVASLVLVRAEGRHHELVTRAALGATRGRLAREMLLESLVLGTVSGALGLGLASASLRLLVAMGPTTIPRLQDVTLDPIVVIFSLVVSILSASIVGAIPVTKYTGQSIALALRSGGRGSSASRDQHRTRNTLVVAQIALALILMVGAGLMMRTFLALRAISPGFTDPQHVQLVRVTIPDAQVGEPEQLVRVQRAMRDRLATIQGVSDVSFTATVPMAGERKRSSIIRQDGPPGEEENASELRWFRFIAPGLFRTIGTPLVAGRDFTWADMDTRQPVAVISKNLARELWGAPEAAVGKRIREGNTSPWREVIGVVDDVYDNGPSQPAPKIVYWPWYMESFYGQPVYVQRGITFAIRTNRAGTAGLLTEARDAIRAVDASVPLTRVRTLGDVYDRQLNVTSFTVTMLAIAAGMALFLGVVGIYGVIAYTVTQRRREIGIRVALGAPYAGVRLMFIRQGVTLGLIGVALGIAGATVVTRVMASLLFGTSSIDPITYGAVSLGLVAIAAVASYVPAHHASKVDPVLALRNQ
jgi:putative ABC transport system permease protein